MKKVIILMFTIIVNISFSMGEIEYKDMKFDKVEAPKEEFRAVWIASVANINWPSGRNLSVEQQKKEFEALLDEVEYMNMNTVIVQIRPAGDTFYSSRLAPWSVYLTGEQGKYPGYDPLEYMIEETHRRGLEFHAWFNPFRVALNKREFENLSKDNFAVKNPEMVVKYGNGYYLNVGEPKVRGHILDIFKEVVANYDIDAVHLDDYFYPYTISGETFRDEKAYAKYGKDFSSVEEWRRDNVNKFVEESYREIKKIDAGVQFGISPFGVWRNKTDDSRGSATAASQTSYDNLYADVLYWIEEGWIDYVIPQIYWNFGFTPAPYEEVLRWWIDETRDKDVKLYIGQGAYKLDNKQWDDSSELINQIHYNRNLNIKGSAFFSIKSLLGSDKGLKTKIRTEIYNEGVGVPQ